jgi:hypothetical protein
MCRFSKLRVDSTLPRQKSCWFSQSGKIRRSSKPRVHSTLPRQKSCRFSQSGKIGENYKSCYPSHPRSAFVICHSRKLKEKTDNCFLCLSILNLHSLVKKAGRIYIDPQCMRMSAGLAKVLSPVYVALGANLLKWYRLQSSVQPRTPTLFEVRQV